MTDKTGWRKDSIHYELIGKNTIDELEKFSKPDKLKVNEYLDVAVIWIGA